MSTPRGRATRMVLRTVVAPALGALLATTGAPRLPEDALQGPPPGLRANPSPTPAGPPAQRGHMDPRLGFVTRDVIEPAAGDAERPVTRPEARRSARQMPGDPHGGCAGAGSLRRRGPA